MSNKINKNQNLSERSETQAYSTAKPHLRKHLLRSEALIAKVLEDMQVNIMHELEFYYSDNRVEIIEPSFMEAKLMLKKRVRILEEQISFAMNEIDKTIKLKYKAKKR